jgi:hypothetical protein
MPILVEPSLGDSRSKRADFLELTALFSSRGRSGKATLLSVLDLAGDAAVEEPIFDEADGSDLDEGIVESTREQAVASTFEELDYRQTSIGDAYPFSIDARNQMVISQGTDANHPGRQIYLFCLLASAIRSDQIQGGDELKDIKQEIANNFQICACLAAGGFLAGKVSSFGFPRATGDAFLPALRNAFLKFGLGAVRAEIPDGLPKELKDGGIDVIAWRDLPDQMAGKLYLLGQSASGSDWRSKSIVEYIPQFHGSWFTEAPAKHNTPAMFIPFPLQHELDEPKRDPFLTALKRRFWHEEQRFGIIFDRIRIPHLANLCLSSPLESRQNVESADKIENVGRWVDRTVALFLHGG